MTTPGITYSRCAASSWRGKAQKSGAFGPGGHNRCVGAAGHEGPHMDEWRNVFTTGPTFRVIARGGADR